MQVTKKDGSKEPFSVEKIVETLGFSIEDGALNEEEVQGFIDAVVNGMADGIKTSQIQVLLIEHAKQRGVQTSSDKLLGVSNQLIMNDLHHIEKRPFEKVAKINTVTKRSGYKAPMDLSKLVEKAHAAVKGIKGVSASELIIDSHITWKEGITTEELQEAMIRTAVDKISEHASNWTYVAARLTIDGMYHKVGKLYGSKKGQAYVHLRKYIEFALTTGKYHDSFFVGYDLDDLNDYIVPERDFQFNYLGIKTFIDRYALKTSDERQIELPQHAFMAIAMFLAQKEKDKQYWAKKFYDVISSFYVMTATPTLSNARLKHHQLSSCFIGSNDDSLEGIFDGYKEKATLSKLGGGVGWDWSQVRAYDSSIASYECVAKGLRPFLKIDNDIALAVDQLGTRNGAFAEYVPDWHMDIFNLIKMRDNGGEERHRAQDIFPAVWVSDEFMRRESNDEMWTLFDPYDVPFLNEVYGEEFERLYRKAEQNPSIRKVKVRARELQAEILQSAYKHGVPFAGYKDTANRENKNKHTGIIRSSNLCTEIFQVTEPERDMYDMMLEDGTVITMSAFETIVTMNGEKRVKYVSVGDMVDGLEVASITRYRSEGKTAICNLASVNLPKMTKLSKEEFFEKIYVAIRMLDNVIDVNLYPSDKIRKTAFASRAIGLGAMGEAEDIAIRRIHFGSDDHVEYIDKYYGWLQEASIEASERLAVEKGAYPEYDGSEWPNPMRNGYLNAIAPTSSISILTGTTSCFEQVFKRSWYEENLSGMTAVTAPNLNIENYEFYHSAYDVSQEKSIEMNAIRTKRFDQGTSFNIFVKPTDNIDIKYLASLYRLAWLSGLKSVYYVRSNAPEQDALEAIDRSFECFGCQ
jgi:ribonucleoside-diphosphate reductase alpha chain